MSWGTEEFEHKNYACVEKDYSVENLWARFLQIADQAFELKRQWDSIVVGNYKKTIIKNNKCVEVYYSYQDKEEAWFSFISERKRKIALHPEMEGIFNQHLSNVKESAFFMK